MQRIPIDLIDIPEWAPNEYDEITFKKLCAMIRQHGQMQSVTVREKVSCEVNTVNLSRWEVISGRMVVKACKSENLQVIWALNVGAVDDVKAYEISLMLNELRFLTDFVSVAEMIKEVVKSSCISNAVTHTMWDARDVSKFMKILRFDWEEFNRAKQDNKLSLFDFSDNDDAAVFEKDDTETFLIEETYKQIEDGTLGQENSEQHDEQPDAGSDKLPEHERALCDEDKHGGAVRADYPDAPELPARATSPDSIEGF